MDRSLSEQLRPHVCLHASFNQGLEADTARGDPTPQVNPQVVQYDPEGGRCGGAVLFRARDHGWQEDELTYAAAENFPYRDGCFDGTVSFWLRGDPDQDLNDAFPVDPFHVSRHAADGSFYFDLTRPNDWRYGSPRKLRWGIYGDNPTQDMFQGGQLLVVSDLGWHDRQWHHVVGTWRNANSGEQNGAAALYIDGIRRAWMQGYQHQLSWNLDQLRIGLGQRYVGAMNDLLILDTCLTQDTVAELYQSTQGDTGLQLS